jgi:hypothetical protein
MSDERKTLIVIEPSVKLNRAAIRQIEAAGYIVVIGHPGAFHVIGDRPPVSDPLVLEAALEAIQHHASTSDTANGNGVRNRFARTLAAKLGYGAAVTLK